MKLGVIIARGGSKRISNKNIKDFNGKPAISYPIKNAINSNLFDRIIVSTDSKQIANIALQYGAEVPFIRPDSLSKDSATTDEAFMHSLKSLEQDYEYACCIYPVTPLLSIQHIIDSFNLLTTAKATSSFPVSESPFPYKRGLLIKDQRISTINEETTHQQSQDLEKVFFDLGQFYWVNVAKYLKEGRLWSSDCVPLVVKKYELIDVDDEEDWRLAEELFSLRKTD